MPDPTPTPAEAKQAATPTPAENKQAEAKPAPAPAENKPAEGGKLAEAKPSDNNLPTDVAELHAMIGQLRKENAADRVNAKAKAAEEAEQGILTKILAALGVTNDNKQPTIEEVTAQLETEKATAKTAQTQIAIMRAGNGIADVDMLLDSAAFTRHIANIDTTDTKALTDAIKTFVTEHPKFSPGTQAATGTSTVEHAGGTGENRTPSTSLADAVARVYKAKQ
ncbi:hypothetical protein [Actinobaculum sp. 352]|uniref:hypothetical protein n=1 Tax=Actinobaculum sp. 352 TaxID=2490946 RepID=UPI000F7E5A31|nr:hypothetical protein [Actinobaculum sp. 352]RTE47898.1 hypothetical protein EKN07_11605 [Actinobaculum sp. 352]